MIPISLELKNFFSHKDSFIDFTLFDSALLIGNVEGNYDISNGSGKSSLFESILWCLFNKSRAASMDDIIFWGENFCKVTFVFKHDGETYRVTRKRSRINSATYVDFARQDSYGNWIDVSGSTSSLTNSEIERTIKLDFKTFTNSAYFRQNDISEFAESDPSRKKGILKSIIDLSKWDEYEEKAKENLKSVKLECKILTAKLENYEELILDFENSKENLENAKKELEQAIFKRKVLEENLQNLTKRYLEIKETLDTNSWDKTTELIDKLKMNLSNALIKQKNSQNNFEEYEKIIAIKKENIKTLTEKISLLEIDQDIDEKIKKINQEFIDVKSKLAASKEMLNNLEQRKISREQCYVCHQPIDDLLYNDLINQHGEEVEKYQRGQVFFQNKLNEINVKTKRMEQIRDNNKNKEKFASKINSLNMELKIAEERFSELKQENEKISLEIITTQNSIQANEKILESIRNDDFRELHKRIIDLREENKELSDAVEKTNHKIGVLTEKTSNLRNRIDEVQEVRKEYLEKQKRISNLEQVVRLLGKNGIQVILLNAIIEDLEKTSNEILSSICNEQFTIFLDTQRVGSDGVSIVDTLDLRVKKDGVVQNFKSLSGGEQFRISLALRIALSEISSRHGGSALEFLLLDEINSPLDRHGIESLFVNVIKSLEKKYKILVITHSDILKEKFSNVIDVTKVNGESSINYISI